MERSLEQYYTKFKRPPTAPIYYPTEEEFNDPISYVAKIKPEAESYGLAKIVPPATFRPPFSIDSSKFEFTPRVQRLNEIDALFRLRVIFINKLVNFWQLQGHQFHLPWTENKYIDLYRLRQLVRELGGLKKVNDDRKWSQIAKTLGLKPISGPLLKQNYTRWIYPYELSLGNSESYESIGGETSGDEVEDCESPFEQNDTTKITKRSLSSSSKSPQQHQKTRMMAGVKGRTRPLPSVEKSSLHHKIDPELVVCHKCSGGDDEALLLLCENCDRSMHTYCLNPPLSAVPKGDWSCPKCVVDAVKNLSNEFGFQDSHTKYNLNSFGEWANNFKQTYFKQAPCDVPSEKVEAAFWQNLINLDSNVQVKYGADLISSKVGSGFPRKEDNFKGVDARERQFYANHPWNLNNLPVLSESVLCHIDHGISGMMVPWVYVGMCFSTFCWHVEDHWTYSINFNHWGETKVWYGIPGSESDLFDRVVRDSVPELFVGQPDLLHHMTTAVNPRFLMEKGVQICTAHQNAGEFVVTFPRAYHCGYNEGLNFAEAVNFAPPDWLKMGRLCLDNYAAVKRTCVFSHEELVMRMVNGSQKMNIGMCIATLEELKHIVVRETDFRKRLSENGLRDSKFCKFEDIADDDARSCQVCRTTLFISALVCRHENRIVCMNHVEGLCVECKISDCCLKYRYTLGELLPLVQKLTERTISFEEWRKKVTEVYAVKRDKNLMDKATTSEKKIDVSQMRTLADSWRSRRYPQCEEIRRISDALVSFDRVAGAVNKILRPKIRLRDNTRCQKADTRSEFSELDLLRTQLRESDLVDQDLEKALEELYEKIRKWETRVHSALEKCSKEFGGVATVDLLLELIYEAEEFNLKLGEIEDLKMELGRCQWLLKANKMLKTCKKHRSPTKSEITVGTTKPNNINAKLQQKSTTIDRFRAKSEDFESDYNDRFRAKSEDFESDYSEESADEDAESYTRVELERLGKALLEAEKWKRGCTRVREAAERLEQLHQIGLANDEKARTFLCNAQGVGYQTANGCWQEIHRTAAWLDSSNVNVFRDEIELARQIAITLPQLVEDSTRAFSLRTLDQLDQQCDRSLFERSGRRHVQVVELRDQLQKFVDRIGMMFQKAVGYYNLFEIISGRSDLLALVEGDPVPLPLFTSTRYSDNWRQIRQFETSRDLMSHLSAITDQQANLLMALRAVNRTRSLKETCTCARDTPPGSRRSSGVDHGVSEATTISCFLCNAGFHNQCAQWEPFFDRLPPGIFLCPRCLRGRRPCIEDVEAACDASPHNSLEYLLVKNLLDKSVAAFGKLQKAVHLIPKSCNLIAISNEQKAMIEQSLVMALSLEVMDSEVYKMVFSASAYFDLYPISARHIQIWRQMQSRMVDAASQPVIFSAALDLPLDRSGELANTSTISGTIVPIGAAGAQRRGSKRHSGRLSVSPAISSTSGVNTGGTASSHSSPIIATVEAEAGEGTSPGGGRGKRMRFRLSAAIYHQDKEICAADKCLRPYSEQVRWIQCESGCARWYHYVCVGQTVKAAMQLSSYCCYKCAQK